MGVKMRASVPRSDRQPSNAHPGDELIHGHRQDETCSICASLGDDRG